MSLVYDRHSCAVSSYAYCRSLISNLVDGNYFLCSWHPYLVVKLPDFPGYLIQNGSPTLANQLQSTYLAVLSSYTVKRTASSILSVDRLYFSTYVLE